jgi:hypothetical protein
MAQWNDFNRTVGGNQVPSIPLAAICHDDDPFSAFSIADCAALQDNWYLPETHLTSSSPMVYLLHGNDSGLSHVESFQRTYMYIGRSVASRIHITRLHT